MDITPLLEHAQSPDAALRNQAEQQLKQLEEQNAVAYLTALASELASSHKPAGARQIAGLILKNALDAPDEKKKARRSPLPPPPRSPADRLRTHRADHCHNAAYRYLTACSHAGRSGRPMGDHGRSGQATHQDGAARYTAF